MTDFLEAVGKARFGPCSGRERDIAVVKQDVVYLNDRQGNFFTARMGAIWNRYGEASGNLGEDWPRALAHELGHYLLFLDDNYLGLDEQARLLTIPAEQ